MVPHPRASREVAAGKDPKIQSIEAAMLPTNRDRVKRAARIRSEFVRRSARR